MSSSSTAANTGDVVTLSETIVGVTKDDLNRITELAVAKDSEGVLQYMLAGHAFMVSDGTKARLLNRGFTSCEVRIIDGDLSGRSGWVLIEMVQ